MHDRAGAGLSEQEIADWVARHMATAPERSEEWGEAVRREYLAGRDDFSESAAA